MAVEQTAKADYVTIRYWLFLILEFACANVGYTYEADLGLRRDNGHGNLPKKLSGLIK